MSRHNRERRRRRETERHLENLKDWRCSGCGGRMQGSIGLQTTADACERFGCHPEQILQLCGHCKTPHLLREDMTIRPLTAGEKFAMHTHCGDQLEAIQAGAVDHLLDAGKFVTVDIKDEMAGAGQ